MKFKTLALLSAMLASVCQAELQHPTEDQLLNTDTIEISLKITRDLNQQVDMKKWLNIAQANSDFITKCYTYPDNQDVEFCEELYKTIRFFCDTQRATPGIGREMFVIGHTSQINETISLDDHEYTLINTLNGEQSKQLLDLCHQAWWATERTQEEQGMILRNSLYLVLIDNATQKIVGFIRAVTDYVRFAGIFDVIVDSNYQGKGLGKLLVEKMLDNPRLAKISLITLYCREDKVGFYEKCGFEKDFEKLVPMRLKKDK